MSAQELVELCLDSKDEAMWTEFVRRFQPLIAGVVIKSLCRRGKFNPTLVDDLVQDTFLKICVNDFRALRRFEFRHENALYGFLKVITKNVVEDYLRKRQPDDEAEDLDPGFSHPSRGPSSTSIESQVRMAEIERALQTLSSEPNFARDYTIFWLYYRYGFTAKQISELPGTGLSVKGVESTLLRMIRLLRDKLNG